MLSCYYLIKFLFFLLSYHIPRQYRILHIKLTLKFLNNYLGACIKQYKKFIYSPKKSSFIKGDFFNMILIKF